MRIILIVTILALTTRGLFAQEKILFKNQSFIKTIQMFMDSSVKIMDSLNLESKYSGVIVIEFNNCESVFFQERDTINGSNIYFDKSICSYQIFLTFSRYFIEEKVPSFYSFYNEQPIVVFTGFELLYKSRKKKQKKMKSELLKYLPEDGLLSGFLTWSVKLNELKDNSIEIVKK